MNIYNKMNNKDISEINKDIYEINIIYEINKKNNFFENDKDYINIFGSEFVKNNKNKCKMIIDNEEYEIKEKFNIKNYNNNILKIKLKGINNITNMSYMFYKCETLSLLPDISKWDTSKVTKMNSMFSYCKTLSSLPDISKWDTSKVINMSDMFYGCKNSLNIPSKFKS